MNAVPRPDPIGQSQPDGALVIAPEELARFGDGDVAQGRRALRLILAAEKNHTLRVGPTAKPANVRIATIKDERAIFDLLMTDLRENAEQVAPINPDKVARHIFICTRGGTVPEFPKGNGVCGVIDGPDKTPVAVVILIRLDWWWSSASYWQEMPLFVHPDHRKSTYASDLTGFARWWTDNFTSHFGYKMRLLCGVLGTKQIREKMLFYRRRFAQVGAAFLYPAPGED